MQTFTFLETRVTSSLNQVESIMNSNQEGISEENIILGKNILDQVRMSLSEMQNTIGIVSAREASNASAKYSNLKSKYDDLVSFFTEQHDRSQLFKNATDSSHTIDDYLDTTLQYGNDATTYGSQIIDNLGKQREKLISTDDNLKSIETSVDDTRGVVGRMKKVQNQKKILAWAAIILLIFAILLIIFITI